MINNQIKNYETNLINVINSSNLPISITCLILDKLKKEADSQLAQTINAELSSQPDNIEDSVE